MFVETKKGFMLLSTQIMHMNKQIMYMVNLNCIQRKVLFDKVQMLSMFIGQESMSIEEVIGDPVPDIRNHLEGKEVLEKSVIYVANVQRIIFLDL